MMLITKAIAKTIPALYTNEDFAYAETKIPLKLFTPWANATWYITEMDVETGDMFGWCDLGHGPGMSEMGYVNLDEIKSLNGPAGLKVERDIHWDTDTTLDMVMGGDKS
jgi:hypothetical protein